MGLMQINGENSHGVFSFTSFTKYAILQHFTIFYWGNMGHWVKLMRFFVSQNEATGEIAIDTVTLIGRGSRANLTKTS